MPKFKFDVAPLRSTNATEVKGRGGFWRGGEDIQEEHSVDVGINIRGQLRSKFFLSNNIYEHGTIS